MGGCSTCCCVLGNAACEDGTTAFERVFMVEQTSSKGCILAVAELHQQEPDFTLAEIEANVLATVEEHKRLRQILTSCGRWEEVDVDVSANHLRWLDEDSQEIRGVAREESKEILEALVSMPAFSEADDSSIPMWQVLVTRRKIIFHVHHVLLDGVGLALVCATLFFGMSADDASDLLTTSKQPANRNCLRDACSCVSSFFRHVSYPGVGLCCPQSASHITGSEGEVAVEDIRYVHLGPYNIQQVSAYAKKNGVTVNSALLSVVTAGMKDYCEASGDEDLSSFTVAVPVNFKAASSGTLEANNDMSAMVIDIPSQDGDGSDMPLVPQSAWSMPKAVGAWAAQGALSLLPFCVVSSLVHYMSKATTLIFSNVNGSAFGDSFVPLAAGRKRKIQVYAYGAMNAALRVFVLANSHGKDLHLSLTLDSTVARNREDLVACLDRRIKMICESA